ncbi:UNVERIFIED_ORG: hypothetical protein B2H93_14740 [Clostridium botulinum]
MEIYTDGSCFQGGRYKSFGGVGAWAYKIISNNNNSYINSGTKIETSSYEMEIEAIKKSLLHLLNIKPNNDIIIYSDSKNTVDIINKIRNDNEKIKNTFQFQNTYNEILELIELIGNKINFSWIKGHSNNKWNNEVDRLAREKAREKADKCIEESGLKIIKKRNNIPIVNFTKAPDDMEQYLFFTKLIVPKPFRYAKPNENKLISKFKTFEENGGIEKAIEVKKDEINGKYILKDRYISYLWLREKGEYWIPIKYIDGKLT